MSPIPEEVLSALVSKHQNLHGYLDGSAINGNTLRISGWLFSVGTRLEAAHLMITTGRKSEKHPIKIGLHRSDVANEWHVEEAEHSGWELVTSTELSGEVTARFNFRFDNDSTYTTEPCSINLGDRVPQSGLRRLMGEITLTRVLRLAGRVASGQFGYLKKRFGMLIEPPANATSHFSLSKAIDAWDPESQDTSTMKESVDIIVPIYNGYEYVSALFESVLRNTAEPYRLILIDDASPDPRIETLISNMAAARPSTLCLKNERNLGFVRTVNRAAEHTANHFVVLNTDVVVPPNWLARLMGPIWRQPDGVASTTPFTNSGTICSFPNFNADNAMLGELPVDTLDQYFSKIDPSMWEITLPSGVGFCMGINRTCYEEIGLFDSERFGRGYAEENDWCLRAAARGYRNSLVPNLFVQHAHGASFGEEKQKLLERNLQTLHELHPDYGNSVAEFIAQDPPMPLRTLIFITVVTRELAPQTNLVIDHNYGGGANFYRQAKLSEYLSGGEAVLLVTYDKECLVYDCTFKFREWSFDFQLRELEELTKLSRLAKLDRIIYNNLVGFPDIIPTVNSLTEIANDNGAEITTLIHDFLPICPSYVLLNDEDRYCGIPEIDVCRKCLQENKIAADAQLNGSVRSPDTWRDAWRRMLNASTRIVTFSENSKSLMQRAYPELPDELFEVEPHSTEYISWQPAEQSAHKESFTVAVVGAINKQKGSRIVQELIENNRTNVRYIVIGTINENIAAELCTVTGPYERKALPGLVSRHEVDAFLLPSIWPETYSYVASELQAFDLPILSFDLGAHAERLRSYPYATLIEEISSESMAAAIESLRMSQRLNRSSSGNGERAG